VATLCTGLGAFLISSVAKAQNYLVPLLQKPGAGNCRV